MLGVALAFALAGLAAAVHAIRLVRALGTPDQRCPRT
jgi:hypothetical protein